MVVDTETTGRDHSRHLCVEVAWWDLTTGHRGHFVPMHGVSTALAGAELEALRINGYIDRITLLPQDLDGDGPRRLAEALDGNTLAGANPAFDSEFLRQVFDVYEPMRLFAYPEWHYRMWDLEAYAAGALGLDYVPGVREVCELLGLDVRPDHTAEGDVTAEGLCFQELFSRVDL